MPKKKAARAKTARPKTKKKVARKRGTAPKKAKKVSASKTASTPVSASLQVIGEITHFFPHVSAGVIKLAGDLKTGDTVQIKGHTTDFKQPVDSMQVDHVPVSEAKKGQEIGLKVKDRVRIGDVVYKL